VAADSIKRLRSRARGATQSGAVRLGVAQALGQLIGFTMLAVISRRCGPTYLGGFQFDVQVETYFSLLATVGLTLLGTRDLATGYGSRRATVVETVVIRLVLGAAAAAMMAVGARAVAPTQVAARLMPLVACYLLIDAVNLEWVLQGLRRPGAIAATRLAGQVAYGAATSATLASGYAGIWRYTVTNLLGVTVAACAVFIALLRNRRRPQRVRGSELGVRLRRSLPLAWSLVMVQIYYSIDSIMLGYLGRPQAVGEYSVAYRLPQAATTLISVWVLVQYSEHASMSANRAAVAARVGPAASAAAVIGLGSLLALPVHTSLMSELFGRAFAAAGWPFAILAVNAAIIMIGVNFGTTLLAIGDERRASLGVTFGALVNIALNFALIPLLGTIGAAVATLVTELFMATYMYRRARRLLGVIDLHIPRAARAVIAIIPSVGLCSALSAFAPAVVAAAGGVIVYGGLVVALKAFPPIRAALGDS
jgi:O-antigen/teichoic acid export membrane protein